MSPDPDPRYADDRGRLPLAASRRERRSQQRQRTSVDAGTASAQDAEGRSVRATSEGPWLVVQLTCGPCHAHLLSFRFDNSDPRDPGFIPGPIGADLHPDRGFTSRRQDGRWRLSTTCPRCAAHHLMGPDRLAALEEGLRALHPPRTSATVSLPMTAGRS